MNFSDRARKFGRVCTFVVLGLLICLFLATTGQETLTNKVDASHAVPAIFSILILGLTALFLQRKTAGKRDLMFAAVLTGVLSVATLIAIGFLVMLAQQTPTGNWSDIGGAFAAIGAAALAIPCILLSLACIGSATSARRLSRP